ncbi:60S ribosomal protein L29-like [Microtus oregoni]|uniref:60S ribosomal protein L29-like n=1 Tax=Microtus oregoni TaxID=111838 RepID=UPI001BB2C86E|nr:60S ribosomal protein L29-like [Microtus oregoni]
MPKSKNHTTQPIPKMAQKGIKKPGHKDNDSLKGVDPTFLRNMCFAKKHNKNGMKKMQANNAKAMSACAEAVKKPQVVKPKRPKDPSRKLSRLAFIAHPELGNRARRLQKPNPKVQTKAEASAPAQVPKGSQAPGKAS